MKSEIDSDENMHKHLEALENVLMESMKNGNRPTSSKTIPRFPKKQKARATWYNKNCSD